MEDGCDVLPKSIHKDFTVEAYVDPTAMDSMFSRLTNPPLECDFARNCGTEGLCMCIDIVSTRVSGEFLNISLPQSTCKLVNTWTFIRVLLGVHTGIPNL